MKILDDSSLEYINGNGIPQKAIDAISNHNPNVDFVAQYDAHVLNPSTQQNGIIFDFNVLQIPTTQAKAQ